MSGLLDDTVPIKGGCRCYCVDYCSLVEMQGWLGFGVRVGRDKMSRAFMAWKFVPGIYDMEICARNFYHENLCQEFLE